MSIVILNIVFIQVIMMFKNQTSFDIHMFFFC